MKVLITYALDEEWAGTTLAGCETLSLRTGVGKVASAARLMQALMQSEPDLVVNVGTAGTVRHDVGTVMVCDRFIDRDMKVAALPGIDWTIDCGASVMRHLSPSCRLLRGSCNTGDSFVTVVSDDADDMYDMEAYAQAYVCRMLGTPFFAIKYATDKIGQNSVKHWEEKLADARRALAELFAAGGIVSLPEQS